MKLFSLKVIESTLLKQGVYVENLEQLLEAEKMIYKANIFKKRAVRYNSKEYPSMTAFCKEHEITLPMAHYWIKLNRHFKGHKIEQI
jgi:hypothetical protein